MESTASVNDIPLGAFASLELLTAIVTLPFVPLLQAVYDVNVPRSTNVTFGTLPVLLLPVVDVAFAVVLEWLVFAGVAGCDGFAASAPAGMAARASAATRMIFLIRISKTSSLEEKRANPFRIRLSSSTPTRSSDRIGYVFELQKLRNRFVSPGTRSTSSTVVPPAEEPCAWRWSRGAAERATAASTVC
jgi:hypothetical protein